MNAFYRVVLAFLVIEITGVVIYAHRLHHGDPTKFPKRWFNDSNITFNLPLIYYVVIYGDIMFIVFIVMSFIFALAYLQPCAPSMEFNVWRRSRSGLLLTPLIIIPHSPDRGLVPETERPA